jgi:hypothetical protein
MRALLLLPALVVATPTLAEEIRCEGPFAADSSEARLIETFGAENVVTGEVPGPEGTTLLATTIFPHDPARTQEIGWWSEEELKTLAYVTVPAGVTLSNGLRIGTTIDEAEALNGGPFELWGFFWDYGGGTSFAEGKLAQLPGDCYVSARFAVGDYPPTLDVGPISGDTQISSSEPLLDEVRAHVVSITLGYPDPSAVED